MSRLLNLFDAQALRRIRVVVVGLMAMGAWSVAPAANIEGQHFDDVIKVARTPLKLNGVGLRGVAFLRAFVAGLYVEKTSTEPAQIIEADSPKRMSIKMLMDAPVDVFVRAITNGVKKNTTPEEQTAMADRVALFQSNVSAVNEVHVGDQIDLDYVPKKGLVFSFNGKERGQAIPGDDLYRAILKMFIGERAVDKKLRQGLLSGGTEHAAVSPTVAPASAPPSVPPSAPTAPASTTPGQPAASQPVPPEPASVPGNVAQSGQVVSQ